MSRQFVVGDVHGCSNALNDLLLRISPAAGDHIIFLGDLVDRGPDSKGVIDTILQLVPQLAVYLIRGNHEIMMWLAKTSTDARSEWLHHGGTDTLRSYGIGNPFGSLDPIPESHWQLINQSLPFVETDSHIFVHAGVDPEIDLENQDQNTLFWLTLPETQRPHKSGKMVVCGHTAQETGRILQGDGLLCIDTLAYGGGWLTCLETCSMRFWQTNQVGQSRIGTL